MAKKDDSKPLPAMDPADFDKWLVFDAIGYKPDDWQRLFHESTARNRYLACGVRVGKTFCLAAEATAAAVCPSPKSLELNEWVGSRGWIVAPTYDLADKLFRQVAKNLRRHFKPFVVSYSERDRILKLRGGGFIQAKSADNPDSLTGEELDWLIIDEACRVGEEEKETAHERLLTRRGWFAAISSPNPCKWFQRGFELGQGAGFHYEFVGEPIKGARYAGLDVRYIPGTGDAVPQYFSCSVPTHANKRLSLDDLADLERQPERLFRQDVLAEFMGKDGAVFSDFERLQTAQRITQGLPGRRYIIGWDVARAKDYSVISVMDFESKEQVFLDRFQGPWNYQEERVIGICRRFNRPDLIVDATGKGDPVAESLKRRNQDAASRAINPRQGHPEDRLGPFAGRIEGLQINNNEKKRELVENLAVGFDHGAVKLLDNPVQAQELRLYEFKQSDSTGIVRYGAPSGHHDDTVMALAMAFWRATRPMGTAAVLLW